MYTEDKVEPIRQTNAMEPCPKCGSVYRRGDLCNWCGEYCPETKQEENHRKKNLAG